MGSRCDLSDTDFSSPSCHKYDTVDYYSIDPSFGTRRIEETGKLAHQSGQGDSEGVFSHTSPSSSPLLTSLKSRKIQVLGLIFYRGFPLQTKMWTKPNFKTFSYFGGILS